LSLSLFTSAVFDLLALAAMYRLSAPRALAVLQRDNTTCRQASVHIMPGRSDLHTWPMEEHALKTEPVVQTALA
jgi:hypothetical protein